MFEFIAGIVLGAAFSPVWIMVGKTIWAFGKTLLEKYSKSSTKAE